WVAQAKPGGRWFERRGLTWGRRAVELHGRGSVLFQCADYAGRTAEPEERIRRCRSLGNALHERRRRNGRVNGIASRREQSDRNMVRPAGRRPRDHWDLA